MEFTMYDQFTELALSRGIDAAAAYARAHGFSSVEFLGTVTPPVRSKEEAHEMRGALENHGLSVACYSVGTSLYRAPDEEERLMQHAELAAALGSPFLHHTLLSSLLPLAENPDFETVLEDVLPRAMSVARHAADLGLTCLYEEQGLYFNGIRNFGTFYYAMKQSVSNVGVCGDLGNILFADECPEDFIRAFVSEIRHVHIKDYRVTDKPVRDTSMRSAGGKYLTETPVGEGDAHVAECLGILREAGYRGKTALEIGFRFPEEYETVAAQDMAYLLNL